MLDGASRLGDLVAEAERDGQPALAITDHGNMYGVLDFYKTCRSKGINPIIGLEAYMAADSRFDRPTRRGKLDDGGGDSSQGEKLYYHLTLLAENNQGYESLIKLASEAYLSGYYYKARLDWELLERHSTGLIATTGCLGGLVNQTILKGDVPGATKICSRLQDIFGKDSLFIELQDHGLSLQHETNPVLIEIAARLGAPLLATNDSHYTKREDADAHDALLCVQTGSTISEEGRFRFEGQEHYLKTSAEMRDLFSDYPEACDNTLTIAERANVVIEFGKARLPTFPVPDEYRVVSKDGQIDYPKSSRKYLRALTLEGSHRRYGNKLDTKVEERINYELSVIESMGFEAYFLVVWDLIRYARERKIRVGPGRGSAAGSCVAYCLEIVEIDPIRNDLIFERFLNPGRKQMPDIDMDFDDRYRSELIKYAADKYGWDHVAQIVTFSTIKARAAVRDSARVLALPYQLGDRIAKSIPPLVMGRDTPLYACLEKHEGYEDGYKAAQELREMYESDPQAKQVIDVARGLEGLRRQDGIHAAAVVITDGPLTDYLPIQRKPEPGKDPGESPIVTQYEMHGVEELGLLKMDFLGLRNLTVIERTLDLIEAAGLARPDIDRVPLDDEKTYELLRSGATIGVFQLEGIAMRNLLRSLAPTSFDDVAAVIALYRPGPMAANMHNDYADRKNNRQEITHLHEDLEPILKDTYGLMIYQESMMRVAQKCAGYTLEEADNLRKAAGKKVREIMAAERDKFVEGCEKSGYGAQLGTKLFDIIEPFADYAFNKSHAYGYGLVSYQTAWLKANHPECFMAALLTSVKDDKDKLAIYLAECRSMGINVKVPDINVSDSQFTPMYSREGEPDKKEIAFGLSGVRNVGEGIVQLVTQERERAGPFQDFYEFCDRVDSAVLNKRTLESLIKAGSFDSLGHLRKGLLMAYEPICDLATSKKKDRDLGIVSLFDSIGEPQDDDQLGLDACQELRVEIPDIEFSSAELLAGEKEMLGLYVSSHPLDGYGQQLLDLSDGSIAEIMESTQTGSFQPGDQLQGGPRGYREDDVKTLCGVITSVNKKYTKAGKAMATFVLEDLTSSIEVWVFPKTFDEYGTSIEEDQIVGVRGKIDLRDDRPKLVMLDYRQVSLEARSKTVQILVSPGRFTPEFSRALGDILKKHPGPNSVVVKIGDSTWQLPEEFGVQVSPGLLGELKALTRQVSVVG